MRWMTNFARHIGTIRAFCALRLSGHAV